MPESEETVTCYACGLTRPWQAMAHNGQPIKAGQLPGFGFLIVTDDYDEAVEWSNGDASIIIPVQLSREGVERFKRQKNAKAE